MSNYKELGAKEMLDQSVVYLYNSYREQGMNASAAKEKVVEDIQNVYSKYTDNGSLPKKPLGVSNPSALLDEVMRDVKAYGEKHPSFKSFITRIVVPKLHRVKSLIK